MEGGINPDATLDYVEFHIFPSQNRYEAHAWSNNIKENTASGLLEQLSLHLPAIKDLSYKGSNTKFTILPPESVNNADWFTTATLARFLHIIGSPDIFSIGKDELTAAFNKIIGSKCSPKDISDLENLAFHFGAKNLSDSLQKFAKTERQKSTDDSSEDDQQSVERSREITRYATPRRSASPMRRIQIGKSGSRRTAALSIKSLNYFPVNEKSTSHRDTSGNSSEEEDSQIPNKNGVSVQDRISLFESKQLDQGVDVKKMKTTVGATKTQLKRWSTGIGEISSPSSPINVAQDGKIDPDSNFNISISKTEICAGKGESEQLKVEVDSVGSESEFSQQKGDEMNTKLNESKAVRHQNDNSKNKNLKEQKGGFYDLYKKKREEKLQMEASGKRVEKDSLFEPMVDEKKPKTVSSKTSSVNRKHNEAQKGQKKSTQLIINSKTTKPNSTPKSSPLPATHKSWPSTPSPQTAGVSPARTPTGPTSTKSTPTTRKPNPNSSAICSSARLKTLKPTQPDANKKTVTKNTKTNVQSSKVTKKSSVVPLETKPFLRKGSRAGPVVGPIMKTKVVARKTKENKVVADTDLTGQNQKECESDQTPEPEVISVGPTESDTRVELHEINIMSEEELEISPDLWVVSEEQEEEQQQDEIIPHKESQSQSPIKIPSRIRHSLSQMLLEDSHETDVGEWGNAEHPPTPIMMHQKEAPRGLNLKRILKFARKAKAESHLTSWSSPSAFSGEDDDDDGDESKATRSFFSLSAFRGNKTNESKLLHH